MNVTLLLFLLTMSTDAHIQKRALQKAREKPQIQKWMDNILAEGILEQENTLSTLVTTVINNFLNDCVPIILYDAQIENDANLINAILQKTQVSFLHGQIGKEYTIKERKLMDSQPNNCVSYVILLNDVIAINRVIGFTTSDKIVLVTKSSQWRVQEFLYSELSRGFVNILIISPSLPKNEDVETYVLCTHKLYADGLGTSEPMILTSWRNGSFTRPGINLFPPKFQKGFSGHRFVTSVAAQPPFVINGGYDQNDDIIWDGSEVRLLKLLSELYNFTIDFKQIYVEPSKSFADVVIKNIKDKKAIIGISGIYVTHERLLDLDITYPHTQDCASFISLTSTVLPKYSAIMGPFHWVVWLALTSVYLLVIFPLTFAHKHTLMHLIKKPKEIENMFWYVFGTFTNSFTFGKESWTKSDKTTPRVLMGFYWIFTTIITACYTGSIIAFITLPIYPKTVDTVQQLLAGKFQIGTLDRGGWERWFRNSSDPNTEALLENVEYLPDIECGLKNITGTFFLPYAFLGSGAQLDYIARTKFTTANKRQLLHIGSECFVPFGVSIVFEKNSLYKDVINKGISSIIQSGFMIKFKHDIEWDMMRSSTGKLLQASRYSLRNMNVEERSLTLDDTQGMFLLLATGFLAGTVAITSEAIIGYINCCRIRKLTAVSLKSNPRIYDTLTPREKINSEELKFLN